MSWDALTDPTAAAAWVTAQSVAKVQRQVADRHCSNLMLSKDGERSGDALCSCGHEYCHAILTRKYAEDRAKMDEFALAPFSAYWAQMPQTSTPEKFLQYKRDWLAWVGLHWLYRGSAEWQNLSDDAWAAIRRIVQQNPHGVAEFTAAWWWMGTDTFAPDAVKRLTGVFGDDTAQALLKTWAVARTTFLKEQEAKDDAKEAAPEPPDDPDVRDVSEALEAFVSEKGFVQAAKLKKHLGVGSKYGDRMSESDYRAALNELGAERRQTTIYVPEELRT